MDGIFLKIVTLPSDLKEGIYHISAVTDDHVILSPALIVEGTSKVHESRTSQRYREYVDGFAAPIPTPSRRVSFPVYLRKQRKLFPQMLRAPE